ncbi:hypothetical protein IWW50_005454 [Coemansia erecta]|nr:hypothetical protein GGF43_004967 [Coemansia sp. RSA 2618]KAJ2819447.1 hypothetical protein IWW50_005454 [Coemansia erecta]
MAGKSSSAAPAKSAGVLQDIINSIFEPGVNHGVMLVMNCAFFGLFIILLYLMIATHFNLHVCALTVIAALLFGSIQWFIKEASAAQQRQASASPSKQTPKMKKKKL